MVNVAPRQMDYSRPRRAPHPALNEVSATRREYSVCRWDTLVSTTNEGEKMTVSIIEKALMAEGIIHEGLLSQSSNAFGMKKAMLFAVIEQDETVSLTLANESGDVYDLLDSDDSRQVAQVSDYIAVLTCGWAMPTDGDDENSELRPSEHPQKRRVRLLVLACADGVASVLRFQDDPDEVISDNDQARGSLADAVKNLFITE